MTNWKRRAKRYKWLYKSAEHDCTKTLELCDKVITERNTLTDDLAKMTAERDEARDDRDAYKKGYEDHKIANEKMAADIIAYNSYLLSFPTYGDRKPDDAVEALKFLSEYLPMWFRNDPEYQESLRTDMIRFASQSETWKVERQMAIDVNTQMQTDYAEQMAENTRLREALEKVKSLLHYGHKFQDWGYVVQSQIVIDSILTPQKPEPVKRLYVRDCFNLIYGDTRVTEFVHMLTPERTHDVEYLRADWVMDHLKKHADGSYAIIVNGERIPVTSDMFQEATE